ncbi:MAG: CBS domain-containing protein, partial [Aurantimonas coralicida]|nr:CBS domain-containing protein [Aurantimonas coralicida]
HVSLAEIMDRGLASAPEALIPQMSCDGVAALWAALAQPSFHRGMQINTGAVLRTFAALPPHLRRHLGPDLLAETVDTVMTVNPKTITPETLAAKALEIVNSSNITALMVVRDRRPVGIVHMHDLLRIGVA